LKSERAWSAPKTGGALLSASRAFPPSVIADMANPPWEEAETRILIVRLSPFRDVDRSISHLFLFSELRSASANTYIDFAFMPDAADRALLVVSHESSGARSTLVASSWFAGLVSGHDPQDFDLVLISNAFSLELLNLPYLFSSAGIPLRASERDAAFGEERSLFILGGSNASCAGALLADDGGTRSGARAFPSDSFVDGLFFGEGEGAIGELASILCDKSLSVPRRLARAQRALSGFLPIPAPKFESADPREAATTSGIRTHNFRRRLLSASPPPLTNPLVLNSEQSSTVKLQITAGCAGLCSFCLEGWDRRPYRELSLEAVVEAARELKRNTGASDLELYAFNFNTHSEVFAMLFELGTIFRRVNLMSQRLDVLAQTPGLFRAEIAAEKRSFTLGIEGISSRMRAFYRKGLSEGDLERLITLLVSESVRELKLFYIISGFEGPEDLTEFAEFTGRLEKERSERAPKLRVLASAGYLARLPFTPLMYAPLALEERRLSSIVASLSEACSQAGIEWRLAVDFDDYYCDQLLASSGARLFPWLAEAPARGHVYDGRVGKGVRASLNSAAQAAGILGPSFSTEKGEDWRPPLAFLEGYSGYRAMWSEYLLSRAEIDRKPCLGGRCDDCGACPDVASRAFVTGHRINLPEADAAAKIWRLTRAKAVFVPLLVEVELPDELSGSTHAYRCAWILRRLFAADTKADRLVFEAKERDYDEESFGLPSGFVGVSAFRLFGPDPQAIARIASLAGFRSVTEERMPESLRVIVEFPHSISEIMGLAKAAQLPRARNTAPLADSPLSALKSWLADERIAFTEAKTGEGRRLVVAAKDLKKKTLLSARIGEDDRLFELEIGPKANLKAWLDRLGSRPAQLGHVRVLPSTRAPNQ